MKAATSTLPIVFMAGLEDGLFPHSRARDDEAELEEERRLCYVGMTRARERLVLTSAARRRVFGDYQPTAPSRFLDEVPSELIELATGFQSSYQRNFPSHEFRPNPYGRGGRSGGGRVRETPETAFAAYENEDQSASGGNPRPGARVRHAQFGVGTVISVEPLEDDAKIVVRFPIGQKTLRAKYARLQPV